jgi:hypothetical protein
METIITEIGGNPFEITLNAALNEQLPVAGYDCLWTIGLKYHQLDEEDMPLPEEREAMLSLSNLMISMIRLGGEIALVGITTYQGVQEVLFYSSHNDVDEIGKIINGFGEGLGADYSSRQLGVQAIEDPNWDSVLGYFELWQAAKQQQN